MCRNRTFLNEVPMSRKLGMMESFSFKYSKLERISPVTCKLWKWVSTLSSIFGSRARSACSTPSYCERNFSFKSTASQTSSFSMISKNFSSKFSKALVMLLWLNDSSDFASTISNASFKSFSSFSAGVGGSCPFDSAFDSVFGLTFMILIFLGALLVYSSPLVCFPRSLSIRASLFGSLACGATYFTGAWPKLGILETGCFRLSSFNPA